MDAAATLFPPLAANDPLAAYAWRLHRVARSGKSEAVIALGTVETQPKPGHRQLDVIIVGINAWSLTPFVLMKNSTKHHWY